jgi:hypothetical protein
VRILGLPVSRRGEQNNFESILLSPRPITMPPERGSWRPTFSPSFVSGQV